MSGEEIRFNFAKYDVGGKGAKAGDGKLTGEEVQKAKADGWNVWDGMPKAGEENQEPPRLNTNEPIFNDKLLKNLKEERQKLIEKGIHPQNGTNPSMLTPEERKILIDAQGVGFKPLDENERDKLYKEPPRLNTQQLLLKFKKMPPVKMPTFPDNSNDYSFDITHQIDKSNDRAFDTTNYLSSGQLNEQLSKINGKQLMEDFQNKYGK